MDIHWVEVIGYGGSAMTVASYSMRTIIPLRIAGILSSFFFIAYSLLINSWPMLLMELTIMPLNVIRLVQLLRLLKQVEGATGDEFDIHWLQPMRRQVKSEQITGCGRSDAAGLSWSARSAAVRASG